MLAGGNHQAFGGGTLRYHLTYGEGFHVYTLTRDQLLFDSQYIQPRLGPPFERTLLYALLEGTVVLRDPEERLDGPCLLRITPSLLEGANGRRPRSFFNYGTPLRLVVLWASNALVVPHARLDAGSVEARHLEWPPGLLAACEDYHQRTERGEAIQSLRAAAERLVEVCIEAGWLRLSAQGAFDKRWGSLIERTFEGLLRAWIHSRNLPSLSDVSGFVGLSRSKLARDIEVFASSIALPGARWRSTTFDLRIRQATTFLSAPHAAIGDVAKIVGYGSVEAMARAFRDAGLPPPIEVRSALRKLVLSLTEEVGIPAARSPGP